MTVVVGTAGHIDHGKTALLRALTGIDADRLPEERERGMTIDVGYAHLALPDGSVLDFVDVPGHDRLIGNMLVGAGEIDAALLVVAADDGPRAQTLEHLELLDALGVRFGVVAITKADLVEPDRVGEVEAAVAALVECTCLRDSPTIVVSSTTGAGIDRLREAFVGLRDRATANAPVVTPSSTGRPRLAVDRAFSVKGRGTVVTGTLRDGVLGPGATLDVLPGGGAVRVRGTQVHGLEVPSALPGRTALNVVGVAPEELRRGVVLAAPGRVAVTDRLLVRLVAPAQLVPSAPPPAMPRPGVRLRLHLGTDQVDAVLAGAGRATDVEPGASEGFAVLRLARPVAAAIGDRLVLRRPSPGSTVAGGVALDPAPPRGVARRRVTAARLATLAAAVEAGDEARMGDALADLHGAVRPPAGRSVEPGRLPVPGALRAGLLVLAPDVVPAVAGAIIEAARDHHERRPLEPGIPIGALRASAATALRRRTDAAESDVAAAADAFVDATVSAGRLVREGDRVRLPGHEVALPPEVDAAMARLEAALDDPLPPPIAEAARATGCPPEGVRALESDGRIVRLDGEVGFAAAAFERYGRVALDLAAAGPVTPAALRDAIGSSRKYVMALLEELDRREILRRTPDGHVPGARAAMGLGR